VRIIRLSELKGVVAIALLAAVLVVALLSLTGKLQKATGINISFSRGTYDKIAFVSDRNGAPDIWVMDPDGSNQRPLTNDSARDAEPAWSPDGKRILFVSDRGTKTAQLFVMRPDGSKVRQVTSSVGAKSLPSFSPDGFSIAYLAAGRVFSVDLTGGHEDQILPTEREVQELKAMGLSDEAMPYRYVCWASDSKHLGAVRELRGIQVAQIVPEPNAEPEIVKDPDGMQMAADRVSVAWARNSLKLAIALDTTRKRHMLAVWDIDNGRFERLFAIAGDTGPDSPDWSPDGQVLAVGMARINADGQAEPAGIAILDTRDGSVISIKAEGAFAPKWSPDGRSILYTLRKDGRSDIWRYDLAAKRSVNLTRGRGSNWSPAWGPSRKVR